MHEILIADSE